MCISGIGARCVRKSSFVRGSSPKTGVRKGFRSVPEFLYNDGASPPKPTPGMGQDGVVPGPRSRGGTGFRLVKWSPSPGPWMLGRTVAGRSRGGGSHRGDGVLRRSCRS